MCDSGPDFLIDPSKRTFLRAAGLLVAGLILPQARADEKSAVASGSGHKVVVRSRPSTPGPQSSSTEPPPDSTR